MGLVLHTYLSFCAYFILFIYTEGSEPSSHLPSCKLQRPFYFNEMHRPGDVILGGLFEVHYTSVFTERTFTSQPQQPSCTG